MRFDWQITNQEVARIAFCYHKAQTANFHFKDKQSNISPATAAVQCSAVQLSAPAHPRLHPTKAFHENSSSCRTCCRGAEPSRWLCRGTSFLSCKPDDVSSSFRDLKHSRASSEVSRNTMVSFTAASCRCRDGERSIWLL